MATGLEPRTVRESFESYLKGEDKFSKGHLDEIRLGFQWIEKIGTCVAIGSISCAACLTLAITVWPVSSTFAAAAVALAYFSQIACAVLGYDVATISKNLEKMVGSKKFPRCNDRFAKSITEGTILAQVFNKNVAWALSRKLYIDGIHRPGSDFTYV